MELIGTGTLEIDLGYSLTSDGFGNAPSAFSDGVFINASASSAIESVSASLSGSDLTGAGSFDSVFGVLTLVFELDDFGTGFPIFDNLIVSTGAERTSRLRAGYRAAAAGRSGCAARSSPRLSSELFGRKTAPPGAVFFASETARETAPLHHIDASHGVVVVEKVDTAQRINFQRVTAHALGGERRGKGQVRHRNLK